MDLPAEAGGEMVELRPGANGWTFLPDDPTNPVNDPVCADETWLAFYKAATSGTAPAPDKLGIAYMLQGGSVADNNNPSATQPPEGKDSAGRSSAHHGRRTKRNGPVGLFQYNADERAVDHVRRYSC